MQVYDTEIAGVKVVEPQAFGDSRGWFCEQYNEERYRAAGIVAGFVQDNESFSSKGVVRGLHWQAGAHCQAKLVRVIKGAVWDVAVDIRRGSPTFGRHVATYLFSKDSKFANYADQLQLGVKTPTRPGLQFYIPRGFAHGFVVLEDETLFSYKCDNLYCKESERGLMFDDPALGIVWPKVDVEITLSDKDRRHPPLAQIEPWEE